MKEEQVDVVLETGNSGTSSGIEEVWDAIKAVIFIANAADLANEDGQIDAIEVLSILVGSSGALLEAIAGGKEIPAELKDLDEAEVATLVSRAKSEFDLRDEVAELVVEDVYRAVLVVAQVYLTHFAGRNSEAKSENQEAVL